MWSIEQLEDHAKAIEEGTVGTASRARMGVVMAPILKSIPLSNYVTPILHILIGKGNDIVNNLMLEMQSVGETYSPDYILAEREVMRVSYELKNARDELTHFLGVNGEYRKDLRHKKRLKRISQSARETVEMELDDLDGKEDDLQRQIDALRALMAKANEAFAKQKKLPKNMKAFGQPLHAEIDQIMRRHGIDRAAMFDGVLQGPAIRKLMLNADSIILDIQDCVLNISP